MLGLDAQIQFIQLHVVLHLHLKLQVLEGLAGFNLVSVRAVLTLVSVLVLFVFTLLLLAQKAPDGIAAGKLRLMQRVQLFLGLGVGI